MRLGDYLEFFCHLRVGNVGFSLIDVPMVFVLFRFGATIDTVPTAWDMES